MIRHEGRGDFARDTRCPDCVSRANKDVGMAEFRCRDCFLPDLTCRACFIRRHRVNPFHIVDVSTVPTCLTFVDLFPSALGWVLLLPDYFERHGPNNSAQSCQLQVRGPDPLLREDSSDTHHRRSRRIPVLLRLYSRNSERSSTSSPRAIPSKPTTSSNMRNVSAFETHAHLFTHGENINLRYVPFD